MKKLSGKKLGLIALAFIILIGAVLVVLHMRSVGESDSKKCPAGESFMYVGNPVGMSKSEIESKSACYPIDRIY